MQRMPQPQDLDVGQRGLAGARQALQGSWRKDEAAAVGQLDDHAPGSTVVTRAGGPGLAARQPPAARPGAVDRLVHFRLRPCVRHALIPLPDEDNPTDGLFEAAAGSGVDAHNHPSACLREAEAASLRRRQVDV
jgi:hypothetical protein